MSTRSTISIKVGQKFKTVYCHSDGYPSYNGKLLKEHFTAPQKIKQLVALGDLSVLGPNIEPIGKVGLVRNWKSGDGFKLTETTEPHSFDNKWNDVVVAYGRDRGETGVETRTYETKDAIDGEDFDYVFEGGVWLVRGVEGTSGFVLLTDIIIAADD